MVKTFHLHKRGSDIKSHLEAYTRNGKMGRAFLGGVVEKHLLDWRCECLEMALCSGDIEGSAFWPNG